MIAGDSGQNDGPHSAAAAIGSLTQSSAAIGSLTSRIGALTQSSMPDHIVQQQLAHVLEALLCAGGSIGGAIGGSIGSIRGSKGGP